MADRTRIAHLIDTGGPGGAETVLSELVERLDGDRWHSIPVVPGPDWLEERLQAVGGSPIRLSADRSFDVNYLVRLIRLLYKQQVDLIHTHLFASAVYGNLAARVCRLPVVSTFHGVVDISDDDPLQTLRFRIMDRSAVRTVFVSESLRSQILTGAGLSRAGASVIYNGIDPGDYSSSRHGGFRAEMGVDDDEILVGAVGNIRPAKNYELLIRTAAELSEAPACYRFVIVGEGGGALLNRLKRLRKRLELEDTVHFAGFRKDIPRVLADLDLFLLTSSSEGFSLSTVQALASTLPVVATRCGGPEEIITNGTHGVLVERHTPEELADAILRLVRNPTAAKRIARAGRQMVEKRFTVNRMVGRYERLYEECL